LSLIQTKTQPRSSRTSQKAGLVPPLKVPKQSQNKLTVGFGTFQCRTTPHFNPPEPVGVSVATPVSNSLRNPRIPRLPSVNCLNSAVQQNQPLTMANKNKVPAPTSCDVPKFNPSKPEELIQFFKLTDNLYMLCGIVDDGPRKETVGKYTDSQTEVEWQAMDAYDNGTWDELKKEITKSYPEAS
jgi:hypothetical protein